MQINKSSSQTFIFKMHVLGRNVNVKLSVGKMIVGSFKATLVQCKSLLSQFISANVSIFLMRPNAISHCSQAPLTVALSDATLYRRVPGAVFLLKSLWVCFKQKLENFCVTSIAAGDMEWETSTHFASNLDKRSTETNIVRMKRSECVQYQIT